MPRNVREWAHRKIEQSCNNMDWSLAHLQEVAETYQTQHPEISEVLTVAQTAIVGIQDMLKKLGASF